MKKTFAWPAAALSLGLLAAGSAAGSPAPASPAPEAGSIAGCFRTNLAQAVAAAEKAGRSVLKGADGWLFFVPELRSLTVGPFWGDAAARVSRCGNPKQADPLPAILDFHRQLKEAGIELLLVPVPQKAAIYPDKLGPILGGGAVPPAEPAPAFARFYELLRSNGVAVADLSAEFRALRARGTPDLYCHQDTHWSSAGCRAAARLIAGQLKSKSWPAPPAGAALVSEERKVEIAGDLWSMLEDPAAPKEQLVLASVGTRDGDDLRPVEPAPASPVLLLGDSHALVFQAGGDLHARGAGLADHLALELGFPVDLIGVRGSGSTASRQNLLRRADGLTGKRVVIWCFSARELTESFSGWRVLPIRRPAEATAP